MLYVYTVVCFDDLINPFLKSYLRFFEKETKGFYFKYLNLFDYFFIFDMSNINLKM